MEGSFLININFAKRDQEDTNLNENKILGLIQKDLEIYGASNFKQNKRNQKQTFKDFKEEKSSFIMGADSMINVIYSSKY